MLRYFLSPNAQRCICWSGNELTNKHSFILLEEIQSAVVLAGQLVNQTITTGWYKEGCKSVFKNPARDPSQKPEKSDSSAKSNRPKTAESSGKPGSSKQ